MFCEILGVLCNIECSVKMCVFCKIFNVLYYFGCSVKFGCFMKLLVFCEILGTVGYCHYYCVDNCLFCSVGGVTLVSVLKNIFINSDIITVVEDYFEKFIFNSIIKMALAAMQRKANVCLIFSFYSILNCSFSGSITSRDKSNTLCSKFTVQNYSRRNV